MKVTLTSVTCLTKLLYFCAFVCTVGGVRYEVNGSSQPIVTTVGDDVILPCHVIPRLNVENLTVEWWRPDLPLDPADPLSDYRFVHRYHDNRDQEDMKNPSYAGRTALMKDGLKYGNISLKILNVRRSDEGRYSCRLPQWGTAAVIQLVVEPISVQTTTTETPLHPRNLQTPDPGDETDVTGGRRHVSALVPPLLLVLLVLGGYLLKHTGQNLNLYAVAPTKA